MSGKLIHTPVARDVVECGRGFRRQDVTNVLRRKLWQFDRRHLNAGFFQSAQRFLVHRIALLELLPLLIVGVWLRGRFEFSFQIADPQAAQRSVG